MSRQDANAAFARTSFLYGGNAAYVEQLQSRYEANPASVDAEWRAFFEGLKDDRADVIKGASGPSWKRRESENMSSWFSRSGRKICMLVPLRPRKAFIAAS